MGKRKPREERPLTPRQKEIADLSAMGMTPKQIANKLGMTAGAVGSHLKIIEATIAGNREIQAENEQGKS